MKVLECQTGEFLRMANLKTHESVLAVAFLLLSAVTTVVLIRDGVSNMSPISKPALVDKETKERNIVSRSSASNVYKQLSDAHVTRQSGEDVSENTSESSSTNSVDAQRKTGQSSQGLSYGVSETSKNIESPNVPASGNIIQSGKAIVVHKLSDEKEKDLMARDYSAYLRYKAQLQRQDMGNVTDESVEEKEERVINRLKTVLSQERVDREAK